MIADQVLQQLQVNRNASRKCCNSIGDQSAIVVEVESGSTSTTIKTITDKSTFNGNVRRRLSATEVPTRPQSQDNSSNNCLEQIEQKNM